MGRFKMPPKPRLMFCWECSRKLYGTIHQEVVVDGTKRIVHKACAGAAVGNGPCTGAEFIEFAQANIEPRSDDEIKEMIADVEHGARERKP